MGEDNWKTLRVPEDAYEKAREQKVAHGRTWGEQLTHGDDVDVSDVLDRLDELEEALTE